MTDSVTVCAFTTAPTDFPLFPLPTELGEDNGLRTVCRLMADKITTVASTTRMRLDRLADKDVLRLNRAVLMFWHRRSAQQARSVKWRLS